MIAAAWAIIEQAPKSLSFTIGLAVFVTLFVFIDYLKRSRIRSEPELPSNLEFYPNRPSIYWYREELSKTRDAWVLWNTSVTARTNQVLDATQLKRILLPCPDLKNPMVEKISEAGGEQVEIVARTILEVTADAQKKGIEVRWWNGLVSNSITIGNPYGQVGWILMEVNLPLLVTSQRPTIRLWRSPEYENLYQSAIKAYQGMWDHQQRTTTPTPLQVSARMSEIDIGKRSPAVPV